MFQGQKPRENATKKMRFWSWGLKTNWFSTSRVNFKNYSTLVHIQFIHIYISGLRIRSFNLCSFALFNLLKSATVSDRSRRSLKKERPWANRSRPNLKKSVNEQIAIIALLKRVTVSKLLSISLKKSNVSDLLVIRANCSKNMSNSLKKRIFRRFLTFL